MYFYVSNIFYWLQNTSFLEALTSFNSAGTQLMMDFEVVYNLLLVRTLGAVNNLINKCV